MKSFYEFILLEKSTLLSLGIPSEVMQMVQYDYEFDDNIDWSKTSRKNILQYPFSSKEKSDIFVGLSLDKIFFLFSYSYDNNVYYNYDVFKKIEDDFGEGWERNRNIIRKNFNLTSELSDFEGIYFVSSNKNYNITPKLKNKIKEEQEKFDKLTENFKKQVKNKAEKLELEISDVPDETGTSELDRMIMEFEDRYSEKENEFLSIPDLIEKYGINKIVKEFLFKKI